MSLEVTAIEGFEIVGEEDGPVMHDALLYVKARSQTTPERASAKPRRGAEVEIWADCGRYRLTFNAEQLTWLRRELAKRAPLEALDGAAAAPSQTPLESAPQASFDLIEHLNFQRAFSERTFGPGAQTQGVLDHIRKELGEIERAPGDLAKWIDVVLLAFDGAWRAGYTSQDIVSALYNKQAKNEARTWPYWRAADPGKAIEHVKR